MTSDASLAEPHPRAQAARGSGVIRFVPKECDDVIILRKFDDVQS